MFGIILAPCDFHSMIEEVLVHPSIRETERDYCGRQVFNHLKIDVVERNISCFKTGKGPRMKYGQTLN